MVLQPDKSDWHVGIYCHCIQLDMILMCLFLIINNYPHDDVITKMKLSWNYVFISNMGIIIYFMLLQYEIGWDGIAGLAIYFLNVAIPKVHVWDQ